MAVEVHIVRLKLVNVDGMGRPIDKETAKLKDMIKGGDMQPRVIEVPGLATSAGYPTIEQYIIAEAGNGFVVRHIDQTMIITYPAGS